MRGLYGEQNRKCWDAIHCTWHTDKKKQMNLQQIKLVLDDEAIEIRTLVVRAKSYTGVERKLKGEYIIAILRIEEEKYMAFVEE